MARTRIDNYTFTKGAAGVGTVKLQGRINLENILLISNLTANEIIYNFADNTKGQAGWSYSATEQLTNVDSNAEGVTTLTLEYDTNAMSNSDRLTVYIEDMRDAARIRPAEVGVDAVDKMRVSTPQSLIDTDFEYSVQPTKWEQLALVQNYQSIFPKGSGGNAYDISALSGDNVLPYSTMTLTTTSPHGLAVGDIISIQETTNQLAEGTFLVLTTPSGTQATYQAKGQVNGSVFATGLTTMSGGGIYDFSGITVSSATSTAFTLTTKTATAVTASPTVVTAGNTVTTATGTSGTPTMTVASANGIFTGMLVTGTNVGVNAHVISVSGTTITVSVNHAGALSATTVTFAHNIINSRSVALSAVTNITALRSFITAGTGVAVPALVNQINGSNVFINTSLTATVTNGTAITVATNGGANAPQITLNDTTGLYVGEGISGTGIAAGTFITAIASPAVTLSANTTGAVSGTMSMNGSNVAITTSAAHGLYPGSPILVSGTTSTANPPNGNWVIRQVPSPTIMYFQTPYLTTGAISFAAGRLLVRPEGYIQHRSLDGGVQITTGSNLTGSQQIRQSRRYFRYQSGKGMQFSTGIKFTPTFDIDLITANTTGAGVRSVTINTFQDHNMVPGATVLVENIAVASGTNPYNGTYLVDTITGTKSFTYKTTADGSFTDTTPGGTELYATCTQWKGAVVRSGLFDEQNGFYFEYDGAVLFTARRQSIKELFGKVSCTQGSNAVTGTGTRFRRQLLQADKVVIKGQTYEVALVSSDTSMAINPAYRGPTASAALVKYVKVQNFKWPQSKWNLDKMDGTGSSGYTLNIAKMQMAYIDYTWYGAGAVRYGFRGPQGDIVYVHKVQNNNLNTSAYMRSGNLPGRFETFNFGKYSRLVAGATATRGSALGGSDTTMHIEDAEYWPTSGFVALNDSTNLEIISYTGIGAFNSSVGGYPITGLTRRATLPLPGVSVDGVWSATAYNVLGTDSTVTFTPDAGVGGAGTAQVGVLFIQATCAPVVSHWGVSVIMDGRYDNDKEVRFVAGMLRYLICQAGIRRPLLAVRIAPSVDSGIGRSFGVRELVNRMQLTLKEVGIYSQGQFLIEGILNPSNVSNVTLPGDWTTTSVGAGSLAQVVYWNDGATYSASPSTAGGTVTGGDRIFGFYAENSGGANFSATRAELNEVRDLGTSILSGNGSVTAPSYPNGPDILVICATLLESTGTKNIACRLAWTEAQA
jgi:hypothetical protein